MHYVYVIKSIHQDTFYIGITKDLRERILRHNNQDSQSTGRYAPWKLVYYEAYTSFKLAKNREMKLKHHGKGFSELKKRILED
jgi:putative endonuclease